VVYWALVEEYLVVLIYLLTLMVVWVVEDVVGLGALALLFLPAVAVVAMSSCGSTKSGASIILIALAQVSDIVLIIKSCYLGQGFHLILFWSTLGSVYTYEAILGQGDHIINELFH